ncbi:Breast cancer 2, early onset [Chytriomyces hyalinus]|nr:Breast cancer 2, early onset [Chytriomyces hyalinus]
MKSESEFAQMLGQVDLMQTPVPDARHLLDLTNSTGTRVANALRRDNSDAEEGDAEYRSPSRRSTGTTVIADLSDSPHSPCFIELAPSFSRLSQMETILDAKSDISQPHQILPLNSAQHSQAAPAPHGLLLQSSLTAESEDASFTHSQMEYILDADAFNCDSTESIPCRQSTESGTANDLHNSNILSKINSNAVADGQFPDEHLVTAADHFSDNESPASPITASQFLFIVANDVPPAVETEGPGPDEAIEGIRSCSTDNTSGTLAAVNSLDLKSRIVRNEEEEKESDPFESISLSTSSFESSKTPLKNLKTSGSQKRRSLTRRNSLEPYVRKSSRKSLDSSAPTNKDEIEDHSTGEVTSSRRTQGKKQKSSTQRKSLGFDVFKKMRTTGSTPKQTELLRDGDNSDGDGELWGKTPPVSKAKRLRQTANPATLSDGISDSDFDGPGDGGSVKKLKNSAAAEDCSGDPVSFETQIPASIPPELCAQDESTNLGSENSDVLRKLKPDTRLLAETLQRALGQMKESDPIGFSTGKLKKIEISAEKMAFGEQYFESVVSESALKPEKGFGAPFKKLEVLRRPPVVLGLADMAGQTRARNEGLSSQLLGRASQKSRIQTQTKEPSPVLKTKDLSEGFSSSVRNSIKDDGLHPATAKHSNLTLKLLAEADSFDTKLMKTTVDKSPKMSGKPSFKSDPANSAMSRCDDGQGILKGGDLSNLDDFRDVTTSQDCSGKAGHSVNPISSSQVSDTASACQSLSQSSFKTEALFEVALKEAERELIPTFKDGATKDSNEITSERGMSQSNAHAETNSFAVHHDSTALPSTEFAETSPKYDSIIPDNASDPLVTPAISYENQSTTDEKNSVLSKSPQPFSANSNFFNAPVDTSSRVSSSSEFSDFSTAKRIFNGDFPVQPTAPPPKKLGGFSTASGRKLKPVSDKSLRAVKNLFGSEDKLFVSTETSRKNDAIIPDNGFDSLVTPAMSYENQCTNDEKRSVLSKSTQPFSANSNFFNAPFDTSSGVSSSSEFSDISAAKHIFNDDFAQPATAPPPKEMGGFSTGSGRKLKPVSDKSLRAVKNLFGSEDKLFDSTDTPQKDGIDSMEPIIFPSFHDEENSECMVDVRKKLATPSAKPVLAASSSQSFRGAPFESPATVPISNTPITPAATAAFISTPAAADKARVRHRNPVQKGFRNPAITPKVQQPSVKSLLKESNVTSLARNNLKSVPNTPSPGLGGFKVPASTTKKYKALTVKTVASPAATPVRSAPKKLFDLTGKKDRKPLAKRACDNFQPCDYNDLVSRNMYMILDSSMQFCHHLIKPTRPETLLNMNSTRAKTFVFEKGGVEWGPAEARHELLEKGASEKYVSIQWVSNHFRWIVWKLAGMVRCFPDTYQSLWNPNYVMEQLLYRYEKEYALGKRSCLKLVIEGDGPAGGLMVLCVADILVGSDRMVSKTSDVDENDVVHLELSDGWYSLKALVDPVLHQAVVRGNIYVGQKLLIFGAQVIGSVGSATPLEVGDSLKLKVFGNSTRRELWDAKLGFQRQQPFQVSLSKIHAEGGPVSMIDVIISKKFELLFYEKTPDGAKFMRSEAEEDAESRKYVAQFESECDKILSEKSRSMDQEPIDLTEIKEQAEEKYPPREVSKMIRYELCDYPPEGVSEPSDAKAILTVWNPDPGMLEIFKEGKRIRMNGVIPDTYNNGSTSHVKLKLSKIKSFMELPTTPERLRLSAYRPREYSKILSLESFKSGCLFDFFGVVVSVAETHIVMADESCEDLLQIQSRKKKLPYVKVGDTLCIRSLVFLFRKHNMVYAQWDSDFCVQATSFNSVEKELKRELLEFMKSEQYAEACSYAMSSQAITRPKKSRVEFSDIIVFDESDAEIKDGTLYVTSHNTSLVRGAQQPHSIAFGGSTEDEHN